MKFFNHTFIRVDGKAYTKSEVKEIIRRFEDKIQWLKDDMHG